MKRPGKEIWGTREDSSRMADKKVTPTLAELGNVLEVFRRYLHVDDAELE